MRVMVILKATQSGEAGQMPKQEDMTAMIAFNEEMMKAGILKSADGLLPSKYGKRVTFRPHRKPSIVDGPFVETKELVAGYWIWEVKSMEEAMEWVMRCPTPSSDEATELEVRPFYGPEHFGEEFTPELQARVEEMHRQEAANSGEKQ